ncbi:hypothetical protein QFC22_006065 [Naganishia vaughanmartiniae]|uniref:Uncharacterized protein n=1 Tax=Naganishia vaughanmartiniae TaxID=1424756 RepID=A0ACC2WP43_9TREE|nr:hypothetical protein QFC22_006065 [Naganishia vaughanmartiniae]
MPALQTSTPTPPTTRIPSKRPAAQDPNMHPSKKQRLDVLPSPTGGSQARGGKGGVIPFGKGVGAARKFGEAVVVAGNGGGARKIGGGGGKKKGLIPTAPSTNNQPSSAGVKTVAEATTGTVLERKEMDKSVVPMEKTKTGSKVHAPTPIPAADAAPVEEAVLSRSGAAKPSMTKSTTTRKVKTKPTETNIKNPQTNNTTTTGSSSTKKLITSRRMPPQKPLELATTTYSNSGQATFGRPKAASGSNPTREIEGRNVVFVTRKTGLGSYMRRCKALLVDEGMNELTLHALCVAIPHAVMLLYALVDILPYPRRFIHHEIRTESVACLDEMVFVSREEQKAGKGGGGNGNGKGKGKEGGKAFSIFEEDEGGLKSRTKSGIRITIRIGKGARTSVEEHAAPFTTSTTSTTTSGGTKRPARPNNVQRAAKRSAAAENDVMEQTQMVGGKGKPAQKRTRTRQEEEESMNEVVVGPPVVVAAAAAVSAPVAAEAAAGGARKPAVVGKKQAQAQAQSSSKRKIKASKGVGAGGAMDVD